MSVTEIGIKRASCKRLLPKVTFAPQTVSSESDPANVMLVHLCTGAQTVLENVDNAILVTSKPPEESVVSRADRSERRIAAGVAPDR